MTFAQGDLVQLKSGGPVMVVAKTGFRRRLLGSEDETEAVEGALCAWFDTTDHLQTDSFPLFALKPRVIK
jgi:uncharacterized protein YodC (DUF2158 family)